MTDPQERIRRLRTGVYTEAILDSAEHCFFESGYAETKMVDVASRAGVSVGTLYKHFAGKEALLAALAVRHREQLFRLMDTCDEIGDPVDRLSAIVMEGLGMAEDEGALFAMYHQLQGVVEAQVVAQGGVGRDETAARFQRAVSDAFEYGQGQGRFHDRIPKERFAATLCAGLNLEMMGWAKGERTDSLRERGQAVLDLLLNGVKS
jgi:AcrR family transcriptional regulator